MSFQGEWILIPFRKFWLKMTAHGAMVVHRVLGVVHTELDHLTSHFFLSKLIQTNMV